MRRIMSAAFVLLLTSGPLAQVQKGEMPGVTNFSRVDATVACGGATTPAAFAELKKQGFASVINLRLATEAGADVDAGRAAAHAAGLKYIHLPFDGANPDAKVVEGFLENIANKANQPAFVHCASANRVGAVWMVKRVVQDGWAEDKALAEAEAIGLSSARLKAFVSDYLAARKR